MKSFLTFTLLVSLALGLPQQWGSNRDSRENFDSADEKTEMIQYTVIETNDKYEIRQYPASTWICTKKEINVNDDPMKDWQTKYKTPYEAVASASFEDSEESKMFMKVFKYIVGVNSQGVEIEMTRPVSTKHTPLEEEGMELREMCFWSGSPWLDKKLPIPLDKDVYIQKRDQIQVYVKRFGGWAMSEEDWQNPHKELREALKDMTDVEPKEYYTAGYNSPFTPINRRNEVWIERIQKRSANSDATSNQEGSRSERLNYEVIDTNEEYELRKYPKSKWACTKVTDIDYSNDFLKNWQDRFQTPFEAMAARKNVESYKPRRKMFTYLYQYISGVNKDFVEIDMTSPVTNKHTLKEGTTLEDVEMCFWSGTPWMDKPMPEPIKEEVYLQERDEMFVYVRKFGGWAMSHQDWEEHRQELIESLGDKKYNKNDYYTVGYQSPWTMKNRRNEVWFTVAKEDI